MSPPRRGRGEREPPGTDQAFEIAARFLAARPRTRWEVERRLKRTGATEATIGATLDRLTELGYLDDAAFVRWWADQRDRHAPRGRRLLEAELRGKGVPREVIEEFRETYAAPERTAEDASLPASDEERARVALEAHLRGRPLPEEPKALQRIGMFLVRRGFDPETARRTLRGYHEPSDAES
jgi:regulatory protein